MLERSALLSLSKRVADLEQRSQSAEGALERIEELLDGLVAKGGLSDGNRNWFVVVFVGILVFAVYVTLVNTPAGLRLAEAGLPPTIAEPGPLRPVYGITQVRVADGVGRAEVTFPKALGAVPVVIATPSSPGGGRGITASVVAASSAGFAVEVIAAGGISATDSVSVYWVAYR